MQKHYLKDDAEQVTKQVSTNIKIRCMITSHTFFTSAEVVTFLCISLIARRLVVKLSPTYFNLSLTKR